MHTLAANGFMQDLPVRNVNAKGCLEACEKMRDRTGRSLKNLNRVFVLVHHRHRDALILSFRIDVAALI